MRRLRSGLAPVLGLLLSAYTSAADPPPSLTFDFAGLGDNNGAAPPNAHGAVGFNLVTTYLMETLSTQVRVQNQSGAVVYGPLSLNAFWWAGSGPNANNLNVSDPRVVYDPFANRWVVVSCDEAESANSRLLVGVSRTPIPDLASSNWYRDAIDVDPGSTLWAKEATVGFSNQWVVVQANIYRISDNALAGSRIYVFDKAQMYSGNLLTSYTTLSLDATYRSSQVPATTYDAGVNDVYLVQMWDAAAGQLRLYKITGAVASPTLTTIGYPTQGAWVDSPGDIEFASQLQGPPGCQYCPSPPCRMRTDDSRIQNVVYRNGKVWTTHTVVLPTPNRASVQWWQLRTDATIAQHGLVDDPFGLRYFAFPSIAVNKNDDVLLGYSRFQGNEFAGASYSFRTAIDPPDTMQSESPVKDGEGCYYKDFGVAPPRSLWGHYSATVVDPSDNLKMWTLQEYAALPNVAYSDPTQRDRWGTWWGMLDPTPVLSITDGSAFEGDAGTKTLTFDLALSIPTSQAVAVQWATADGTATAVDNDYVAASGTVAFAPGETAKTFVVTLKGDVKREVDETFRVDIALTAPTVGTATLPDTQALGTILNDDALPQISIGDRLVVEGSPSGFTPAAFVVTLSNPSATTVTVQYNAAAGSAFAGADFGTASGTVTFAPGEVAKTVTVNVIRDLAVEPDETFYVNLLSPSGGTLQRSLGNGVILDDDAPKPPVIGLVVVSDDRRNRLQWQNPVWSTAPSGIVVRYTAGAVGCTPPALPTDGSAIGVPLGMPGQVRFENDTNFPLVNGWQYCYTVFVDYGGAGFSSGVSAKGIPFLPDKVRWKYFAGTGTTSVAPPTVGQDAALMPSNDFFIHGMGRGATGGIWPALWTPPNLGSPAQARSPIVPFAGGSRYFVTTQDGWVHAIDAKTGTRIWETQIGTPAVAAPAGVFVAFGGAWDYVLVGTSLGSGNHFYALDPANGAVIDSYPKTGDYGFGALGAVTGMATVDYARGQVYFAAKTGTDSLWCLKLGPPTDALQFAWATSRTTLDEIDGSPVLRANRLYVGNISGRLWAVDPANGGALYYSDTGDGIVKGFPFPDRRNGDVYFVTTIDASTGRVVAVTDTGATFTPKWSFVAQGPSTPLLSTGTDKLYVGVGTALSGPGVLQCALNDGSSTNPVDLAPSGVVIGAPSLDLGVSPNMLYVGSTAGVIYAVTVPF